MSRARIQRVAHVILNVRDPLKSAQWYHDVLGMELMNVNEDFGVAFLSFGTQDHDIGLARAPQGTPLGSPGVSHVALMLDGDEDGLRSFYARVREHGGQIDFVADHGVSKSFYFFDPDGNRLEIFYQVLHGEQARDFIRTHGGIREPYELEDTSSD
jgi:catechol 2,3-dioxygenase